MMIRRARDRLERSGCVDVPVDPHCSRGYAGNGVLQFLIEDADAAGLDQHVGRARRRLERAAPAVWRRGVDDPPGPIRFVDVAMGLALEGVGLEEGDVVAEGRNLL